MKLKKFMRDLIIELSKEGFKPIGISFNEMFKLFDFKSFCENIVLKQDDDFSKVIHKLSLCDAFFMPDYIDYKSISNVPFDVFVIKYCGGSELLLREKFGQFERCESSTMPAFKHIHGRYYVSGATIYHHEPRSFIFNWVLSHFSGANCFEFGGSYIVSEFSIGLSSLEKVVLECFRYSNSFFLSSGKYREAVGKKIGADLT